MDRFKYKKHPTKRGEPVPTGKRVDAQYPDYLRTNGEDVKQIIGYNKRRGHKIAGAVVTVSGSFYCTFKTNCPEIKMIELTTPYVKPLGRNKGNKLRGRL